MDPSNDSSAALSGDVDMKEEEGGKQHSEIREGKATLTRPMNDEGGGSVFYNQVQEFNRDLTVTVLRQFVADRREEASRVAAEKEADTTQQHQTGDAEPAPKRAKVVDSRPVERIKILDGLSASGLRAIRFAKEVPDVEAVMANDFSQEAVETIRHNVKLNGVEDKVTTSYGDAVEVMMAHRAFKDRFHAIDLDPYGSASLFFDSAVQSVADHGILMVTCTDMATLCGNTPEACYNKYGAIPLRHKSCHEVALRIVLKCISEHAARHGRYIKPLLSISVDFYVRCFVQLFSGAKIAKQNPVNLAHVRACATCHSFEFQTVIRKTTDQKKNVHYSNVHFRSSLVANSIPTPAATPTVSDGPEKQAANGTGTEEGNGSTPKEKMEGGSDQQQLKAHCNHCGGTAIHMAGPLYIAPMHDPEFVAKLLKQLETMPDEDRLGTHHRMIGVLSVISEELHDVPLYQEYSQMMSVVKCSTPKLLVFRSALLHAGFRCSISHSNANALKTDAPTSLLWDICRAWAKKNNVNLEKLKNNPTGKWILSASSGPIAVNFSMHQSAMVDSQKKALIRFQDNKGKNWGPKARAKGPTGTPKDGGGDDGGKKSTD